MTINTPLWIFGQGVGVMAASIILSDLVVAASTGWISCGSLRSGTSWILLGS
jgi:hypothetical protein